MGQLIYLPDPFMTDTGTIVYDALYLSGNGFVIALGSDREAPGLVETYPNLVSACQRMTELRHDPDEEFIAPDEIDVNADEVLAHMEANVVWRG